MLVDFLTSTWSVVGGTITIIVVGIVGWIAAKKQGAKEAEIKRLLDDYEERLETIKKSKEVRDEVHTKDEDALRVHARKWLRNKPE